MAEVHSEFMERLAAERAEVPSEAITESVEEPIEGDPEMVEEEIGEVGDTENTEEDLDTEEGAHEGDPSDVEESEVSPEYTELEAKYKSLEAEFSRVTANRKEIESSLDQAQSANVQFKHQLEDKYKEAEAIAAHFAGMATQQLQNLQQINPSTLTQEQFGQYQQALQQAQFQVQQNAQLFEGIQKHIAEAKEATLEREAEVARERLKTRIPDWSADKYKELGSVAEEYGYSSEEFFGSTDYRLVLLLNEVQKGKEAAKVVTERSKKTKTKPPRTRSAAATQQRNEKGQFTNAKKQWESAEPGTRGAFAQMKAAQLRAERTR